MIRVLFVCMGNICRSPMAEAVFADLVAKAGLSAHISADSAGTGGWHVGEAAHHGTLAVLKAQGIPYDGRARQLQKGDLRAFDYVLAMDTDNLSDIEDKVNKDSSAHVGLFLEYAHKAGTVDVRQVPDPYYDNTFDRVYDLVTKGSHALLAFLRQQHGL